MAVSRQRSAVTLPKSYFGGKNLVKFEGYTQVSLIEFPANLKKGRPP
jgi:hypothetical protein